MVGDLKEHFWRRELSCRCCSKLGLAPLFLHKLESLRGDYGEPMSVNCGCRCPKHNKEVGGAPRSMHLTNLSGDGIPEGLTGSCAVDIHCPMESDNAVARERLIRLARERSWSIGHYETFVHLDCRHTIWDMKRVEWTEQ